MTRAIIATLVGLASLASGPLAHADPYFNENVWASPIYDKRICTGTTIDLFETDDLQQDGFYAPDTSLVVKGDGYPPVYNDNSTSSTKSSSVIAESVSGCYDVMVFATHWWRKGTADIRSKPLPCGRSR